MSFAVRLPLRWTICFACCVIALLRSTHHRRRSPWSASSPTDDGAPGAPGAVSYLPHLTTAVCAHHGKNRLVMATWYKRKEAADRLLSALLRQVKKLRSIARSRVHFHHLRATQTADDGGGRIPRCVRTVLLFVKRTNTNTCTCLLPEIGRMCACVHAKILYLLHK